jgi:hypothetical protein
MNQPSFSRLRKAAGNGTELSARFVSNLVDRFRPKCRQTASQPPFAASADQLRQLSARLEKHFLETSADLEALAARGEDFVQETEKLVNNATGRVGGTTIFLNAMRVVEPPLTFLGISHAQSVEFLRRLKEDAERIEALIRAQAEIERTIAPLKFIQALFKIESAPLGAEVQGMFGALTRDIEQLHDQICELFATKFIELRSIRHTVGEVTEELQTQTDTLWKTISKERIKIDESLQRLQKELADNVKRESRISNLSREVNREIQQVVVGLQYQDIINQKLEHTWTALDDMEAEMDGAHDPSMLATSCRLQAEQIQAIRHDLAGAENTVRMGSDKILAHLVNADSHCVSLEEFQQLTITSDGMVQVMFDIFATLRKEIGVTAESSARAFEKLRSISGLASNMTIVVRDLSQRIHLIGLNAQIQAALVEKGVGLEVLSARTSEISRATNQISEDVARQLDQLVAGLTGSVTSLETLRSSAVEQQTTLNVDGAATEATLHGMRDDALTSMNRVTSLLAEVRTKSQEVTKTLTYVENYDGLLARIQTELTDLAKSFAKAPPAPARKLGSFVHQLRHKYTMSSERNIYAKVMGDEMVAAPCAEDNSPMLFHEVPAPTARAAEPVTPSPASSCEPEPKSAAPAAGAANTGASSPAAAADLGSNVELF